MVDLAVVGAGPAGLELASRCSGFMDVAVLEEHRKPGEPNHCSGLISRNIDSISKPPKGCIEHKVRGAIFHSPSGRKIVLKKKDFAAYVIDRSEFDSAMVEGIDCELLMGSRLDSISFGNGSARLGFGKKTIDAKVVAGADGSSSVVGRSLGAEPREKIPGIISVEKKNDYSEFVELWFDKSLTDCFLWKIPRGEKTEYGMWGSGSRFDVLEKFFSIKGKQERRGGAIPIGPPKTYFNNALLVGDAAAQVKPWSGGGVVYGMLCARIAADVLVKAKDFSERSLREYELRWKKAIGRQIAAGMFMRRIYRKSSNSQIDIMMGTAGYLKLLNRLDMDFILKKN
jgi:geranylgeranyl reductase family protein